MKQCFGYVRVSTVKQGEGVSLSAQREAIEHFVARNGIEIINWFEEKQTAAKGGRPVFSAMLKELRHGKAAGVVMHKIDRSARNFSDWAKIGDLSDAGIDVHFASESLDFRSRGGRLSADIQAVIAADYVRNLREETVKGMNGRLAQGLYPFDAPIGYLNNGGGRPKTLDPVAAPLVKKAFELYGGGQHSIRSIQKELKRIGLVNFRGKALTKTGVENLLANPFYCGVIKVRTTGMTYPGVHEPLISAAQFDRVQSIKSGKIFKRVTRHNHTYRGLFRCALCHAAMTPERQKGHVYYRCQNLDCATKCIREDRIEAQVKKVISGFKLRDADMEEFISRFVAWFEKRRKSSSSQSAQMQLAQIDNRLDRLTDAYVDQLIDKQIFNRRQERLLLQRKQTEQAVRDAGNHGAVARQVQKFLEHATSLINCYNFAEPDEKRELVEWATSNRSVHGKTLYLEPSERLVAVDNAATVLFGGPDGDTSRIPQEIQDQQMEKFVEIIKSEEVSDPQEGR